MFKLNPTIAPEQTEFLLVTAAMDHLHPILTAIFIAALTSALMSTSDSSILAGASVVTQNILPFFKVKLSEKAELRWTRIMVVIIGLVSIVIALFAGTIYDLAMVALSLLLVGLFAPFAFGMYWKKANTSGAITAFLGGFAVWVAMILFYFPTTIEACGGDFSCGFWDAVYIGSTPAFAVSVVLIIVVSLLTQKRDKLLQLTDVDGKYMSLKNPFGNLPLKDALFPKDDEEGKSIEPEPVPGD